MSGICHDLQRTIYQFLKANRDGSFETQKSRKDILYPFAKTLVELGYGLRDIRGLKRKHIEAVLAHWQSKGLSQATIKNRMAVLRHLCERLNKSHLIEKKNAALGIPNRVYVPVRNRAVVNPDLSVIDHPFIRVSLELQRVLGLRREEALKIQPWKADKGDSLYLHASWCKGGRERHVPIRTEEQRYWLDQAKALVKYKNDALIPRDKSYIQHRYTYTNVTSRAGFKNLHGLRHAYAQARYAELAGFPAPINGGLTAKQLTAEQKEKDDAARCMIAEELGHHRKQITVNYLSR
jgi:site-specific recombinase XerD